MSHAEQGAIDRACDRDPPPHRPPSATAGSRARAFARASAAADQEPAERARPRRTMLAKVLRFGISGVATTGVHLALATLLITAFSASPVLANSIAFVCATACSYLLNTLWSFSARPHHENFLRYLCVSIFGLILTIAISWTAQRIGASYWTGLFYIVLIVTPITFLLQHSWTYRQSFRK